jgi:hypothetical protein
VSVPQSVRDALADAETLLSVGQSVYADSLHYDATARRAALPIIFLDAGRIQLFKTRHVRNRDRAAGRAHLAFRVCPALREARP